MTDIYLTIRVYNFQWPSKAFVEHRLQTECVYMYSNKKIILKYGQCKLVSTHIHLKPLRRTEQFF